MSLLSYLINVGSQIVMHVVEHKTHVLVVRKFVAKLIIKH